MIDKDIALKKFHQHKKNALQRNIPFLFTFDEWYSMWDASGKWDQRGIKSNQYCMARHNDIGPYATYNVTIQTIKENSQFAVSHRDNKKWLKNIRMIRQSITWRNKITKEGNGQYKGSIKGTNLITGENIILSGKNEILAKGFSCTHVYKCVNGKSKSHKGYSFIRL